MVVPNTTRDAAMAWGSAARFLDGLTFSSWKESSPCFFLSPKAIFPFNFTVYYGRSFEITCRHQRRDWGKKGAYTQKWEDQRHASMNGRKCSVSSTLSFLFASSAFSVSPLHLTFVFSHVSQRCRRRSARIGGCENHGRRKARSMARDVG